MDEVLFYVVVLNKCCSSYHRTMEILCDNGSKSEFMVISVKAHINFSTQLDYSYSISQL